MKTKMKRRVLVLFFLSLSISQIPIVMASKHTAILVTSKPAYAIGEVVYFALTNTGTEPIEGTYSNPWTIYKDVGGTWKPVYAPPYNPVGLNINPGEGRSWKWNPLFEQDFDSATVTVDAGTYKVEVDITKAGTSSATFIIEEPAPGSCSGSLLLGIFVLMGLFLSTRIH